MDEMRDMIAKAIAEKLSLTMTAARIAAKAAIDVLSKSYSDRWIFPDKDTPEAPS